MDKKVQNVLTVALGLIVLGLMIFGAYELALEIGCDCR